MKIGIVSDTHGSYKDVANSLLENNVDVIIHLGDYSDDGKDIGEITNKPIYVVRGNNDYVATDEPSELLINIGGIDFFITHGHKYNVYSGLTNLMFRAKAAGAQVVLFGHTHVYLKEVSDNILFLNPGSPSYPRFNDKKGYIIFDTETLKTNRIYMEDK